MPIMQDCGITKEQVEIVQKTWQAVYKDKENSGVFLFHILFEMYPDYEKYFVRFKKEGQASLYDNPEFQKHIKHLVMDALNVVVVNLENDKTLTEALTGVAINHQKRNIKRPQFVAIGKVVLETLKRALGTTYTPDAEEAWTKIVTCAMDYMGNITG